MKLVEWLEGSEVNSKQNTSYKQHKLKGILDRRAIQNGKICKSKWYQNKTDKSKQNKNKKPKRLENSQLIRKTWHVNQIFELILEQCAANYYGDNTIAK